VQIICKRFKDDIPDITAENICEKIADFFIDAVIRPVAKETKQEDATPPHHLNSAQAQVSEPATAVDDSTEQDDNSLHYSNHTENFYDNHTDNYNENTTNINETSLSSVTNNITLINDNRSNTITINISENNANELAELKSLIKYLYSSFLNLDDEGCALCIGSGFRTSEEQNEQEQNFQAHKDAFINESKNLRRYYLTFPELVEIFEKLLSLSQTLTFKYEFKNNEHNEVIFVAEPKIEEYKEYIKKVSGALFK
jgi:hypothetical protein